MAQMEISYSVSALIGVFCGPSLDSVAAGRAGVFVVKF
jgi:hypothetical protein